MSMIDYTYLATATDTLSYSEKAKLSYDDLITLYEENLWDHHLHCLKSLRSYYDVLNTLKFLSHEECDPRGHFNALELEDAIVAKDGLIECIHDYLEKYSSTKDRLAHSDELLFDYYTFLEGEGGFLKTYAEYEKNITIASAKYRSKKYDIPFHDDDIHTEINAEVVFEEDLGVFKTRLGDAKSPTDFQNALQKTRFEYYSEIVDHDPAGITGRLAYYILFNINCDALLMQHEKASHIINQLVKDSA